MNKKHQGVGEPQISQREETEKTIFEYLFKIDNIPIDDSSRGIRAISRATKIGSKSLTNALSRLNSGKKVLEVSGKNRSRLFCVYSQDNKKWIKILRDERSFELKKSKKPHKNNQVHKDNILKNLEKSTRFFEFAKKLTCNEELVNSIEPEDDRNNLKLVKFIADLFFSQLPMYKAQLDGRQKLLPQMLPFLSALDSLTSGNDIRKNYFKKIVEKIEIPTKEYLEFMKIRSHSDFIKIAHDNPLNWGFLDIKCPSCNKFALKTKWYPDGKWDIICTNLDAHERDKAPHYPAEFLRKWFDDLRSNKDEVAIKYLKRHGIKVALY